MSDADLSIRNRNGGQTSTDDLDGGERNDREARRMDAEDQTRGDRGPDALRVERIRWIRRIAIGIFTAQFVGLCIWSIEVYHHFALTWDFATYAQAIFQIWHGNLYPFSTLLLVPIWGNTGQVILWLIALVTAPFQSAMLLLWLQDAAVAGIGLAVFWWITELFEEQRVRQAWLLWLSGVTVVALVANPWIYWSATFDIHTETFCTLFLVMAARALYHERWKSLLVWSLLVVSGGLVECTYLVALGVTALLVGKRYWKAGAALIVAPLGYFLVVNGPLQGAQMSQFVSTYGYLAGRSSNGARLGFFQLLIVIATHPFRVIKEIWIQRANVWANVAPGGVIGLFNRWAVSIAIVVLISDILTRAFGAVAFQNLPVSTFVTIGSIMFLIRWSNATSGKQNLLRGIAVAVSTLMLVGSIGWTVVWSSRLETQWFNTSSGAISVLSKALKLIPNSDEVVVSQGVSGAFSLRNEIRVPLEPVPQFIPLTTPQVWFVITPDDGTELAPPAFTYAAIQQLVSKEGAKIVFAQNRVFVLKLNVPNYRSVPAPTLVYGQATSNSLGGWLLTGAAGRAVTSGPMSAWHTTATGAQGYVTAYAYWGESPGSYQVKVRLLASGPVNVEVWDITDNRLLLRRSPPPTNGTISTVTYQVTASAGPPQTAYSGWGPFQILPVEPSPTNVLEVRVWSPGKEIVKVYNVAFSSVSN